MKYRIKRKKKILKTKYIFLIFLLILISISSSYALLSSKLVIEGRAIGNKMQLDVIYVNIANSNSYPASIGYMDTYTNTFTGSVIISSITMGEDVLVLNRDYTYSNGTLTIPNVTDNIIIRGENLELEDFTIKYVFGDNIEFNGASYIDTDIKLFSVANVNRDFEMTLNIDSSKYVSGQTHNTVFNCADHNKSPYPGFTFRKTSSTKYVFKRTSASAVETNYDNSLTSIQLIRTGTKLYAKMNNSELTEMCDYSNLPWNVNSNLLFGADMDGQSKPFRYFTGKLSNVSVKNKYSGEEAPIVLPSPTRTGYVFKGWYSDSELTNLVGRGGDIYNPNGDSILYAKWHDNNESLEDGEDEYIHNGQYNFGTKNYINTHMYPYTPNNIHKNFEMTFDITSLGSGTNYATLMSAVKNVLRIEGNDNKLLLTTSGNTAESKVKNIPSTITNVRIVRIDDKLYYSFNGNDFLQINSYVSSSNYSTLPLIFGADYNASEVIYRNFDGILSNIHVKYISDNASIEDYSGSPQGTLTTVYEHAGNYEFTGQNNIDTQLTLFDFDTYYKDFEISFNIESIDSNISGQATIVNAKYENSTEGYPGFVYRLDREKVNLEFSAAKADGTPILVTKENVYSVKISRRDLKMYIKINDEEEIQDYDFGSYTDFFDTTLTIGSSKDANNQIFRPFIGVLSNIVVKVEQ